MAKRNLIYIMAPSYTGSTLLTCLMAGHPEISTIGELKASAMGDADKYRCSCGSPIKMCGFWQRVGMQMRRRGVNFDIACFRTHFSSLSFVCNRLLGSGMRGRLFESFRNLGIRLFPKCREELNKIIDHNYRLIEVICDIQGGHTFLDGSKDPIRLKHFIYANRWHIKVIYLVRDGRATTNSYMRHHDVPMEIAAREWVIVHRECDRMAAELNPETLITVKYEDFCRNPKKALNDIYEFTGLSSTFNNVGYEPSAYHILGNTMRLSPVTEILADEKWRTVLSQNDLNTFKCIAGPLNRSYGYR